MMVDFHSATKLIQQTDKLVLWYGIKHWLDEVIDVSILHIGKPERSPPIHFQIRLVVHNHSFGIIVKGKFQVIDFLFLLSFNFDHVQLGVTFQVYRSSSNGFMRSNACLLPQLTILGNLLENFLLLAKTLLILKPALKVYHEFT